MRRIFTSFILLCTMLGMYAQTDYGVFIGNTEITSANCNDFFGDGTVKYDPATNTLTLNNADIDGEFDNSYRGIRTTVKLAIDLKGSNKIIGSYCILNEGDYSASADEYGITIYSSTGTGSLSIEGMSGITTGNYGLYIHDCTLNVLYTEVGVYGLLYGQNKKLKIKDANVNISVNDIVPGHSTSSCISGYEEMILEDCHIEEPTGAYFKYESSDGRIYNSNGTDCTSLKIKKDPVIDYYIKINNDESTTKVTNRNCNDVFGDGTVSFNRAEETLTFNNAQLSDKDVFITDYNNLYSKFNIKLIGSNYLKSFMAHQDDRMFNITINGDGSLLVEDNKSSSVFYLKGNLTIENCRVSINNQDNEGKGIYLGESWESDERGVLTVRNASLSVTGKNGSIRNISGLVLEGCGILSPEGAHFDATAHAIVDNNGDIIKSTINIGQIPPTTISHTTDNANTIMPAYNLAGQRVNNGFNGIVIKNGKKVICK